MRRMGRIVFLFIGILCCATSLSAQERNASIESQLAAIPRVENASGPTFQWQDSLGGIQKATADLMVENQRLGQEYNALNAEASRLQDEFAERSHENRALQDEIMVKQMELLSPFGAVKTSPLQNDLVLTKKVIAQEKQALSVLKVKLRTMESQTGLLQLKIKGLELDKRAILVDRKARVDSVSLEGAAELKRIRASLEALKGEESALLDKIADARGSLRPLSKEEQKKIRERNELKAEISVWEADKSDFVKRIKERDAVLNSASFRRYRDLLARQEELAGKADGLKKQKVALETNAPQAEPVVAPLKDWEGNIRKVNDENKDIEQQIADLRENIAVLEYKINNLERYKHRKRSGT